MACVSEEALPRKPGEAISPQYMVLTVKTVPPPMPASRRAAYSK